VGGGGYGRTCAARNDEPPCHGERDIARFPVKFWFSSKQVSADDGGNGVLAQGASSRAPTSYTDGVSRAPCSTIASLSVIPTL
jgi:hypothetical protein